MNSIKRKSKLNGQPQRALNKLMLQESGNMSVRSNGRWRYRFRKITKEEYFQLPYDDRKRLILEEYYRSRSLMILQKPIVLRGNRPSWSVAACGVGE